MAGDFLPPQLIKAKPEDAFLVSVFLPVGTSLSQKTTGQTRKLWLTPSASRV